MDLEKDRRLIDEQATMGDHRRNLPIHVGYGCTAWDTSSVVVAFLTDRLDEARRPWARSLPSNEMARSIVCGHVDCDAPPNDHTEDDQIVND